jgi:sugar/nucleoside kinase (ribokinase family)
MQAARLGLNVGSIGHVGKDAYGRYMDRVLQQEGVNSVISILPPEMHGTTLDETGLCFVLVDPQGRCAAAVHCRAAVLRALTTQLHSHDAKQLPSSC